MFLYFCNVLLLTLSNQTLVPRERYICMHESCSLVCWLCQYKSLKSLQTEQLHKTSRAKDLKLAKPSTINANIVLCFLFHCAGKIVAPSLLERQFDFEWKLFLFWNERRLEQQRAAP